MLVFFALQIIIFIIHISVFLSLTIVIACITLVERKVLSLIQRRVGPNYIGYKGRLQFLADAIKLLAKHIIVINKNNRFFFLVMPATSLSLAYMFWINIIWAPNLAFFEIEHNLLFMGILSILFSITLYLVGIVSNNKYTILSAFRVLIVTMCLELLLNFIIIYLLLMYNSFSFYQIISFQQTDIYAIFNLLPTLPILLIVFLLETGRIPFDLGEAESELIAGYTTEMGGFFFALFYLAEYFHLYCFSLVYTICFLGGWFL